MDDKERIEKIMQEKNLSNVIFCAKTNIAPASLSHIIGGRTKPTLPILRNIIAAFPDLNPEWVFMGTGEMYIGPSCDSAAFQSGQNSDNISDESGNDTNQFHSGMPSTDNTSVHSKEHDASYSALSGNKQDVPLYNFGDTNAGTIQEHMKQASMPNISDIVRETLVAVQKPQRKIIEVRIFFDDGTFETFSPNK
ncbi:MAG: helix-turn-helix transcriptional regulator [Bacteroides sp.]|nr:helix-turn-helix transcriptional regulator [Roseburia sp.]MCM1347685.1 helix-turn-helix transcriptional regulator [Bacteroides sp.]MCM1420505.1 helix-turn-helix transcriptional regulator [Bacteroides sp.]